VPARSPVRGILCEVTRVESLTVGSVDAGGLLVVLNCTTEVDATSVVHVIVADVSVTAPAVTPEIWGAVVVVGDPWEGTARIKSVDRDRTQFFIELSFG
jgi:hypothetical protein